MESLHIFLWVVVLCLTLNGATGQAKNGCRFKSKDCSYNILLRHSEGNDDGVELKGCDNEPKVVQLDQIQNDLYTAKIDNVERMIVDFKISQENQLKEIEKSILNLVGSGSGKSPNHTPGDEQHIDGLLKGLVNEHTLGIVTKEFNMMQQFIDEKSEKLVQTQDRLDQITRKMEQYQVSQIQKQGKLNTLSRQVGNLTRERNILLNQLKDAKFRIRSNTKKAIDCSSESFAQKNRINELVRSASRFHEELEVSQYKMNRTVKELNKLKNKHRDLKTRHERTKKIMRIREKELIDCYAAKTSTFCGFEDPKLCGFTNINDTSDFFDWTRGFGPTSSKETGPTFDHTCNSTKGHYMFIEASSKAEGSNAILYSPLYRGLKEQCVEFYYHMYGKNIGTLNVYAQARGDALYSAWRAFGNQGNVWTRARLAIPKELARAGYQIAFEGIAWRGHRGDIAIDDISVIDGACSSDVRASKVKLSKNSTAIIHRGKKFARKIKRKSKMKNRT